MPSSDMTLSKTVPDLDPAANRAVDDQDRIGARGPSRVRGKTNRQMVARQRPPRRIPEVKVEGART